MRRETVKMESLNVRPASIDDKEPILDLFRAVFESSRSGEWWQWQFYQNPFSRPIIWLAETPERRLVGHYSLIPVPFLKKGIVEKAGFSIHSMIHPDFQRRGILQRLASSAEIQLSGDGIDVGATFLNDNSLPVYTQRLGWKELPGQLPIFVGFLDTAPFVKKVWNSFPSWVPTLANAVIGLTKRPSSVNIEEINRFDERTDALWKKISQNIAFATYRDSNYLNWRISQSPYSYQTFAAQTGDAIDGFITLRCDSKFGVRVGYIVEWMFDPEKTGVGESLLSHAASTLRGAGVDMITALANAPSYHRTILRRAGFFQPPKFLMPHGMHFCLKNRVASADELLNPSRWYLSWSDHDVV